MGMRETNIAGSRSIYATMTTIRLLTIRAHISCHWVPVGAGESGRLSKGGDTTAVNAHKP